MHSGFPVCVCGGHTVCVLATPHLHMVERLSCVCVCVCVCWLETMCGGHTVYICGMLAFMRVVVTPCVCVWRGGFIVCQCVGQPHVHMGGGLHVCVCVCVCGVHTVCVFRGWLPCACGVTPYIYSVWAFLCGCSVHTMCVCGVLALLCVCGIHTMCVCGMFAFPRVWCSHHECMWCVYFPACVVVTPCV